VGSRRWTLKSAVESRRKKGGETVSKDREHMSEIGRKGGEASGEKRREEDR